MWEWIQGLQPGAATFLGALAGSLFGLLAILAGAMFNAHLNRKRDDRLREEEREALSNALFGILGAIRTSIATRTSYLTPSMSDASWDLVACPIPLLADLQSMYLQLGNLDPEVAKRIFDFVEFVGEVEGLLSRVRNGTFVAPESSETVRPLFEMTFERAAELQRLLAPSIGEKAKVLRVLEMDIASWSLGKRKTEHPLPSHVCGDAKPNDV
jgi:hypothetical protein